ncbi:UDP-N-acetylglucosamine 2-epimerase [Bacillus sp. 31A1R]|uniref:UDP-N-acetylglucosamine 2-epimerase n=2 Tax=Robertmurraya mangrovi TaxID=3098077 RepID=A0ABU5IXS5_9BACI|nr:UDP-N-acetylglucosamine 2-epimerase [Bacillus sp. 31A1R]
MMKKKICVFTGSRADYGLLYWIMKVIQEDSDLELQIIVAGMHLSAEFGNTYTQIENDGFFISEKVEMLLTADTPTSVAKSIGLGTIGFADSLGRLKPDLLIILGDRFEALAIAQTALVLNIPIAHIHGGEVSFGAYDDSIRHAITKMSYLHFVATEDYRKRVIRLGENPERVFNVGAPGIENIFKLKLYSKRELESELQMSLTSPLFLVTHHPTTLSDNPIEGTLELLEALEYFNDATIIFTKSNADNYGRTINNLVTDFVNRNKFRTKFYDSLGQTRYLSLIKEANVVIGNSSSGLLEVPYLQTPTVNIGSRQKGRLSPESVFNSKPDVIDIKENIQRALDFKFQNNTNYKLFGDGNTSTKIISIIKENLNFTTIKEFYDGDIR